MNDFSLEELIPVLVEVIESGGEFRLYPRGTSMLPLLRQGIDSVALVAPDGKRRRGEILLYRRSNGQYVLHRLVRIGKNGSLQFSGDNHKDLENGIANAQIIATVTAVFRGEKRKDVNSPGMRLYAFVLSHQCPKRLFLFARRALAYIKRKCKK